MKKLFALLAVAIGVVACQKDQADMGVNLGGEQEAFITVNLPEVSRAGSESGAFENGVLNTHDLRYILEIYYGEKCYRQVQYTNETSASFPVRLAPGRAYNFVVWADFVEKDNHADLFYKTSDGLDEISILNGAPMTEARDAFYGNYTLAADKHVANMDAITLTRPFAKIRVVTTDVKDLTKVGVALPTNAKVTYQTPINNKFNALTGVASSDVNAVKNYTFNYANTYAVENGEMTLFADYLFVNANATTKFVLTVTDHVTKSFNTEIPVVANQVTTIKGDILTNGSDINVEVNPDFGGGNDWPDENNNAEQLAYAAMFGGEVTLTEDVVLTQPLTIVEGANVVINLGGKTLTGAIDLAEGAELTVNNGVINNTDRTVSGITTNGNLTLNNVTIESARHGVRVESGKVVINGGEYKVAPISTSTLHALNVGDDGTTAEVVIKGGTFIGPKGTMADSGSAVNVRNGSSVVIEGGNFSGGKTKTLSGNITVKGGTFDQNPSAFVAAGYKAIAADGIYYVLPETIANAAEAEGVTSVTESPADVATALATNNGEATLFMWNDVAYIAKYGEVVITSIADEATTVRGVVESSAGLTNATVAEGIEVVGNRTFRKCANLETVELPNTLTEIGPAVFQSCSKLANITIPESVTTIGEGAFAECTALTSINIPAGITRLEKDVLRNTGLVSVEIPASVNYIGTWAFRDCESLTDIKILSPEFTIENNTFTNMTAPVPTMTIHVVNAEMKAYLESVLTNYDKTYITVVGPTSASNTEGLNTAVTEKYAIVNVAAGNYTFPSSVAAGVTIKCEEGTVFTGTSGLNINGATVIGAEFKNENGVAVSGTINGTFKNCTFTGYEALRWCYSEAGTTNVFENCVIKTDFRGFHYDNMKGDVIFRNCEINGFNAYGGEGTATFEGCTFGCDESGYNGLNIYSNTNLINCTFNFVSGKTNFIDMEGTGKTLKITNCVATLDGANADISNFVGGSQLSNNTVIYE